MCGMGDGWENGERQGVGVIMESPRPSIWPGEKGTRGEELLTALTAHKLVLPARSATTCAWSQRGTGEHSLQIAWSTAVVWICCASERFPSFVSIVSYFKQVT